MKIIKIDPNRPQLKAIESAVKVLEHGGVIVYPTDTCYGLGADAYNPIAVDKIYKIKGRGASKPLSVIVKNISQIEKKTEVNQAQKKYLKKYLPGPVTFILLNTNFKFLKQNTLGIRIPDFKITKLLSDNFSNPYTTTSANISGKDVCYSTEELIKQFSENEIKPDLLLDAGVLSKSLPSTIADIITLPPKIIRQGSVKIK